MSLLLEKGFWFRIDKMSCGHWSARISIGGGVAVHDGFSSSSEALIWIEQMRAKDKVPA